MRGDKTTLRRRAENACSAARSVWRNPAGIVALAALALFGPEALAQGLPAFTSQPGPGGSQSYTLSVQALVGLTALGFLPAVLLMMTSFTRIIIVLSLLRHALGTQSSPPNQVLVGLSLFLTFFVMSPVLETAHRDAYLPWSENKIDFNQALARAEPAIKSFMLKQTREPDLALFLKLANEPLPDDPRAVPLKVAVPAFVTSELKTAFQIGFMV